MAMIMDTAMPNFTRNFSRTAIVIVYLINYNLLRGTKIAIFHEISIIFLAMDL